MSFARRVVFLVGVLLAGSPVAAEGAHENAETAFQRGDLRQAARLCQTHLAENPDDARMTVLLGLVQLRQAESLERAGRPRTEVTPFFLQARQTLLRAETLSSGTTLPNLHHAVGLTWMAERRFAEAIDRFSKAIRDQPERADLYRLRGSGLLEIGEIDAAISDLGRAVALAPGDLAIRLLQSDALYRSGRAEDARTTLQDYLKQIGDEPGDDRHFKALYEVFTYSLLMNDFEGAVNALEAARPLRPDNLTVRSELGALYYRLGRFDEAGREYAAILAAPDPPPSLAFKAHHHRGLVHQHEGRHDEARGEFENALVLSPNRAEVLKSYGAVLRRLGEDEQARRVLERFREVVGPENDIRLSRNRLRKNPQDRSAHVRLVTLLIDLGRHGEARTELRNFRKVFPGDRTVAELEARLVDE